MPELLLGQTAPDDAGGFVTSIGKADAISTSLAARIAGCSHDTMTRWVEEGRVVGVGAYRRAVEDRSLLTARLSRPHRKRHRGSKTTSSATSVGFPLDFWPGGGFPLD